MSEKGMSGDLRWCLEPTTDGDGEAVWTWYVTHQETGEHAAGESRCELKATALLLFSARLIDSESSRAIMPHIAR